ncbi:MAG: hypothetical protein HC929_11065 [Leptolyngbyaceae cyanobacterium SM2_5_2]|nr:hypothetical protein [Leptolyngbyaceae cyanobacterium SM2_5_2]
MTWLRPLDNLSPADLPQVGYAAYYLGLLRQHQLPVVAGQVVISKAWQAVLENCHWPASSPLTALTELDIAAFQTLQRASQEAQHVFQAASLSSALVAELQQWPHPTWMLQASLGLEQTPARPFVGNQPLPTHVGTDSTVALDLALKTFWQQALTARSLVVWHRYCHHIRDVNLATLIMPLYPAQASGTLTLAEEWGNLEVVLGLGLSLSLGEAIPARCRFSLARPEAADWELGFQEQVYQVSQALSHLPASPTPWLPVQVTRRDPPALEHPLTLDQLRR